MDGNNGNMSISASRARREFPALLPRAARAAYNIPEGKSGPHAGSGRQRIMKWFRRTIKHQSADPEAVQATDALREIRDKFSTFYAVLDRNNHVLKNMSDMELTARSGCPVETSEIRYSVDRIRRGVRDIVRNLIVLGGGEYKALDERLRDINRAINKRMPGHRPIEEDVFTAPFEDLTRDDVWRVGCKNAHLGEMKSRLGLPVPHGFAITAWAYKVFMDTNNLQERVTQYIHGVDIASFEDLVRAADGIQDMVLESPVPAPVAAAIEAACERLSRQCGDAPLAVRSSAIGEDTFYSFAGQYASFLNVRCEDVLLRYREVLASKFSAKAIYYFLSHSMSEADLAMSAGVMSMVDASVSGVMYTRDPVRPRDGCLMINAVPGLGKPLMDGAAPPDMFKVSREHGALQSACVTEKREQLLIRGSELSVEPVPRDSRNAPCLDADQLAQLAACAMTIEGHYGSPQDVEWAIDGQGRLFLLQTRPLRIMEEAYRTDQGGLPGVQPLLEGGATICPGAGGGPVFHAICTKDLTAIPEDAVVVAPQPFPALVTALNKISALIIAEPGVASHTATLAREHGTPTICGMDSALALPAGKLVTVDATAACVYDGIQDQLLKARQTQCSFCSEDASRELLLDLMAYITPLNLMHPNDANFTPARCETLHDITRFAHQKAIDEMFTGARELQHKDHISLRLKSDLPLEMNVIYIDQDLSRYGNREIPESDIDSLPMKAFWEGLRSERWPVHLSDSRPQGLATSASHRRGSSFSQISFAVLSREFMMLSLRMGYHFCTIEAMCADQPNKNFIRMQLKQGGASPDRRARRVRLITHIMAAMGFDDNSKGDFLDVETAYHSAEAVQDKLRRIGRLTVMTKQLDMALSNDAITEWYTQDMLKKLGLAAPAPDAPPEKG